MILHAVLAAIGAFSFGHSLAVARILAKVKAPLIVYAVSLPFWFVFWPAMSVKALWAAVE